MIVLLVMLLQIWLRCSVNVVFDWADDNEASWLRLLPVSAIANILKMVLALAAMG